MADEQIKDYLLKYKITSEEGLAQHIEELKRCTKPNNELIFPLVEMLVNRKDSLLAFFRENETLKIDKKYSVLKGIVMNNIMGLLQEEMVADWHSKESSHVDKVYIKFMQSTNPTEAYSVLNPHINKVISAKEKIESPLKFTTLEQETITEKEQDKLSRQHIGHSTRHKAHNMSHRLIEEGIEKQNELSYETTHIVRKTKPSENSTRLTIDYYDIDFEKVKDVSISDIDFRLNSSLSYEQKEEEIFRNWNKTSTTPIAYDFKFPVTGHIFPKQKGEDEKKSAQIQKTVESIGKKESDGKLHYEISWRFIEAMAQRMANNKSDKYPAYNWRKKIEIQDLKDAINRHHIEVMDGNYQDGDEVLGHIVSYACNAMMLWEQLKNNK